LIDTTQELGLISSHSDHIKRLYRLTFDPENTLYSIRHSLFLSTTSHNLIRLPIL
ncbi:hypothetical protein AMECASPLE_000490, partial [Ameca splendens]